MPAIPFHTNLDLKLNAITNFTVEVLPTLPDKPMAVGRMVMTGGILYVANEVDKWASLYPNASSAGVNVEIFEINEGDWTEVATGVWECERTANQPVVYNANLVNMDSTPAGLVTNCSSYFGEQSVTVQVASSSPMTNQFQLRVISAPA